MPVWLAVVLGIVSGMAALTVLTTFLVKGSRWMLKTWRKLEDFLDDWNGTPARPGVPARKGVMDRLDAIEAQLHPNGGSTLRDKVDLIAENVTPD